MDAMNGRIRHLYYNRKKSYEEIAELLGISVDEVTKCLFGETFNKTSDDNKSENILKFPSNRPKPFECDASSLLSLIIIYDKLDDIERVINLDDTESIHYLLLFLHKLYNEVEDQKVKDIIAHRITTVVTLLLPETNDESNS